MLHNYSWSPAVFRDNTAAGDKSTDLRMGVENETTQVSSVAARCSVVALTDAIDDISGGNIYCKSDGSIGNGAELVTHPGTLRWHSSAFSWKHVLRTVEKNGYRGHLAGTCGLHVHVGRAQLGADDAERARVIRKCTALLTRYWDETVTFTRRTAAQLDHWASAPSMRYDYRRDMTGSELETLVGNAVRTRPTSNSHDSSRYTALNTCNTATIEFRIFRATLNRDTLIATLQFVSNLVTYAQTHSYDEIQASTWADVALLRPYNELCGYLAWRGLLPDDYTVPAFGTRHVCVFDGRDGVPAAPACDAYL